MPYGKTSSSLNLNELSIPGKRGDEPLKPDRVATHVPAPGPVTAFFDDLEDNLVECISRAEAVVGCTAWLTSEPVLKALAKKKQACILVQKEDFLRPDTGNWSRAWLHALYAAVPGVCRWEIGPQIYDVLGDCDSAGVRCVGAYGRSARTSPRMHHKFMVFGQVKETIRRVPNFGHYFNGLPWESEPVTYCDQKELRFVPYAVRTGSFNPTRNGSRSLENAVFIKDYTIANAYYEEWGLLPGLSESLDWSGEYVDPEYRIGS